MDRSLLIRGKALLESWEDLSTRHLYNWLRQYFPVAFKETEKDLFEAYPIEIYCNGSIIHTPPKPTDQAIDAEYTRTFGWDDAQKDNDVIPKLYFSVIAANEYLLKKGFRLNVHSEQIWSSRVSQAERTATSLDGVFAIEHRLKIDSEEFEKWNIFINSLKVTKRIRLSLAIFLDSLTGKSNTDLATDHARASISRYKSEGKKFIVENVEMFKHLPRIPL